ncbi:MAG: UDP-N-acetylmuramoyl-tripeptide--D-alanyl-D-alanine ligase [Ornithinimicrobium sp.]
MIPLSLDDIARVTGGRVHPDHAAHQVVTSAVVTDSREAVDGCLYVARTGEHADGHDFVPAAGAAGAVAAMTTREMDDLPCVVVDDVTEGFAALAAEVVRRCTAQNGLRIVGITGSSGKTSTKDVMGQVIGELGPTIAPHASYNSEVGVPLTVARLEADTAYLVAEMGASGVGHIDFLTRIAPPEVSVVLNVGSAHLSEFGSRGAIADAKAEIVRALRPDGLAVLNVDDPNVASMASQSAAPVIFVGRGERAQVRADDVELNDRGQASFRLTIPGSDPVPVALGTHGEHHVDNALAVAAVAHHWGMAPPDIAASLSSARPRSRWRMEVTERGDGVTVVNDAYNANPESMAAALRALAAMRSSGRAIAVIGEMRELGEDSEREHEKIGELAAELGIDDVISVGPGAAGAARAFKVVNLDAGRQSDDTDDARDVLESMLRHGDVVLLKSSRDSGLRYLGDSLASGGATS